MNLDSITVAAVTGGSVTGPPALFSGLSIDSRKVAPGDLFIALKGPNHDAHDFLAEALVNAAGALVGRIPEGLSKGHSLVRVPNTLTALHALARYVRATLSPRVVAVVGSVGKTTTKELVATVLARRFAVAKTTGNLNNTIGMPAEVVRMPEGTEVAVLEMGMSTPGEIKLLSELVRPDVAVVTAIQPEHMANFSSLAGVLDANAEILVGLSRKGTVVANGDDAGARALAGRHSGPVILFSLAKGDATVWASSIAEGPDGTRFVLHVPEGEEPVSLPLPGRHNVANFLAAAAVGVALGMQVGEIARAAGSAIAAPHRGEIHELPDGTVVYDDAYNSSPAALEAAFAAFEALGKGRRLVAVVGDMLEMGRFAAEYHAEAGRTLAGRAALLVAVGEESRRLAENAREAQRVSRPSVNETQPVRLRENVVLEAKDAEAAAALLLPLLQPGDAVFVKASRGMRLEKVVAAILAAKKGAG